MLMGTMRDHARLYDTRPGALQKISGDLLLPFNDSGKRRLPALLRR